MSAPFAPGDYAAVLEELAALSDPQYKKFHEGLIPGTRMAYGVRVPQLRAVARRVIRQDPRGFLAAGRPASYEETMLRGMVIAGMPLPMGERLPLVEGFLPLIDNWAVCDTFCGSFKLKKEEDRAPMWEFLLPRFQSEEEFTARFAVVMLLSHYVTEDKIEEALRLLEGMAQPQYYVRMAVAWAVSVCYVKFPGPALGLLQKRALPAFTQNKSIQKIRESRRVGPEEKAALLQYKKEEAKGPPHAH